ncbi:MAG: TetM/TetW/TetO/TetS family tetracycline resistance ribosomal protection protein [Chlorobi bacterium]|nr:TetM/TetW/TetO/TetS family tetracycline resistance ribosomal protection protein [Chlorobiota bacterium]
MSKKIKNIGILAHVDAGKTTLTESFLFLANAIKQKGNVDRGSAVTDNLDVEKERGISVRAASASFFWKDYQINLIDTPGHADFSAEVERTLSVMDGAILIISAAEGVQAHTYTLWEALKNMNIPVIIFINKIDREGADYSNTLKEIQEELKAPVFPLLGAKNEGSREATIFALFEDRDLDGENLKIKETALESLAGKDEEILEKYLNEEPIGQQLLFDKAIQHTLSREIFPVFCGIAKQDIGISELLGAAMDFLPDAKTDINATTSAFVFKVEHNKTLGRIAHVRLFSGKIKVRDTIRIAGRDKEGKIAEIKKATIGKFENITELFAGDIGVISGLQEVRAGDILGSTKSIPHPVSLQQTVITVQVKANKDEDYAKLAEALSELNSEDPLLDFKWFKEEREMHLKLMGNIQAGILGSVLKSRFGIEAEFTEPTVIYKETPADLAEGYVEYTLPKPCWAVMKFRVEPGERSSGIQFESKVGVNKIKQKYQNEVERTIPKALVQGIKGWETTDIKVTLTEGEDHEIHSRPGDFILATPMGLMQALKNAGTNFLEPIYDFEIKAQEIFLGKIVGDLTKMRATFESPLFEGDVFLIKGKIPVATSMNYSIQLNSLTGGKGKLKLRFGGYAPCDEEHGKTRDYKGVNPLDESQWILHHRGAFKADERNF